MIGGRHRCRSSKTDGTATKKKNVQTIPKKKKTAIRESTKVRRAISMADAHQLTYVRTFTAPTTQFCCVVVVANCFGTDGWRIGAAAIYGGLDPLVRRAQRLRLITGSHRWGKITANNERQSQIARTEMSRKKHKITSDGL